MINKIIFLEGPDGSGKTTLANSLIKTHKANYFHSTFSKDLGITLYRHSNHLIAAENLASIDDVCVIDRSIISLMIYEYIFPRPELVEDINSYVPGAWDKMKNGFMTVICLPNKETWKRIFINEKDKKKELYTDEKIMEQIYDVYERFFTHEKIQDCPFPLLNKLIENNNFMRYNWEEDSCQKKLEV